MARSVGCDRATSTAQTRVAAVITGEGLRENKAMLNALDELAMSPAEEGEYTQKAVGTVNS
jgi:hypothetical protein